jgi:hypothetical protein
MRPENEAQHPAGVRAGRYLKAGMRMLWSGARTPSRYGVSYPKSGRTWLRAMVGRVLCRRTGLPESQLLNTRLLTAAAGLGVTTWHHGGGSLKNPCPPHDALEFDAARFAGKHVLFVMRDPRDTLISAYFQSLKRELAFEGDISSYLRSNERGILKWIAFHNMWQANRDRLASFHLVRYEALHQQPIATLREALEALGVQRVTEEELADAVEFARFENLKRLEASGALRSAALRPKDRSDPNSFKVRQGRVGGYRETLSADDLAFIDDALRRTPCALYQLQYD